MNFINERQINWIDVWAGVGVGLALILLAFCVLS
jgi:hypothetical protein